MYDILIKHHDKWRGDYYLKEDLNFSSSASEAARFYLLKSGNTSILNGDRITIHLGNKTLTISDSNQLRLVDRDHVHHETSSFIITSDNDNTDPIIYESPYFFISNKEQEMALKYEWGMDAIGTDPSTPGSITYKLRDQPRLVHSTYNGTCGMHTNSFQFSFQRTEGPMISATIARRATAGPSIANVATQIRDDTIDYFNTGDMLEGYKGPVMILLLMVILVLCILISK